MIKNVNPQTSNFKLQSLHLSKLLIIRFSSIGDIVLTTPVIRGLRNTLPGVEIHCVTKKSFSFIYKQNPYIDKVIELDSNIWKTIHELRKENYDHIIDLHHNQRTALVKGLLLRPWTSFHKLNIEKWLMVNFKVNHLPALHIVDRYLETVKKLGVRNDGKGLDYFIPENEEYDIGLLPEAYRKGYMAVVAGARFATKKLPADRLAEICLKINVPVVLLGGKEDLADAGNIKLKLGNQCVDLCGKISLNQSASLIRHSNLVLTNDTGLMHIAAAFDKKIISFWGNTIPEFGMYPYYPAASLNKPEIIEIKGLSCRPCSKIGFQKCPKKHFRCMMDIDTDQVTQKALLLIGQE